MKFSYIIELALYCCILLSGCNSGQTNNQNLTGDMDNDEKNLQEACSINGKQSEYNLNNIINAISAREQWNANNGYCGEVSLISAGLYYGQYVSQYDARVLANPEIPADKRQFYQILIGTYKTGGADNNMVTAAKNMHLNYIEFNNLNPSEQTSQMFLQWVKQQVIHHYPVAIGVYENSSVFGQSPDPEYDHIVPVFGISSSHAITESPAAYYKDDIIYLHDNGLFTGEGYSPEGCYRYRFGAFQKSRKNADLPTAKVYSLSNNSNQDGNYGIAITGPKAVGTNLLPVSIQTNPIYEIPKMEHKSNIRPLSESMTLTVTVSGLTPDHNYTMYRYSSFSNLPIDDDFSKSPGTPNLSCNINIESGNKYIRNEEFRSDNTVIYRVLLAIDKNLPPCPND